MTRHGKGAAQELVTEQSMTADLRRLGVEEGMVVLVHSSLSAIGWVCGGPVAVIRALLWAVGANGTLVMPAHSSDLSDPAGWKNPPAPAAWWDTIREVMPAFDSAITPTSHLGVTPELAKQRLQVERQDTATRTGVVGQARCKLLPVRPLVDFAIPWLKRHRNDGD